MLAFVTIAILLTMALALFRALRGPTVFDRILAVSMISTKTTLLIAVVGFLFGRPDFLDIALLYALINFIGAIAVLKFYKYGSLGLASHLEAVPEPLDAVPGLASAPAASGSHGTESQGANKPAGKPAP